MGNRVSIQFQNGTEKSVVLFSHWGGMGFVKIAKEYAAELNKGDGCGEPLDRREPRTVMVDFISHITKGERVTHDFYLGCTEHDGDNWGNGHHIIKLKPCRGATDDQPEPSEYGGVEYHGGGDQPETIAKTVRAGK